MSPSLPILFILMMGIVALAAIAIEAVIRWLERGINERRTPLPPPNVRSQRPNAWDAHDYWRGEE